MASTISPCVSTTPLSPGTRNEFHAGLQQAFSKYLVVDGEYIWKYTQRGFDFSILGDSPITFPVEWAKSKIPGYAIRASVPNTHGFTAFVVMSSVAARFFGPQVAGVGAAPGGSEVFRIDHDETLTRPLTCNTSRSSAAPGWASTGATIAAWWQAPCRARAAIAPMGRTGPTPSWMRRLSRRINSSRPDSLAAACLRPRRLRSVPIACARRASTASKYVKIPAAGTENDDHNPPRIAPRNLFDLSVGEDNLFNGDKYKWSLRLSAINLMNKEALYNFISTFSGTHYVTPRALTVELGFHF